MKALPKKKVITKTKARARAWKACSDYIKRRDGKKGNGVCVTCGVKKPLQKLHVGHFISRRFYSTLFDERNVHIQCPQCNIYLYGNTILYYHFMEKKYGKKIIEELESLRDQPVKYTVNDLLELEAFFKAK